MFRNYLNLALRNLSKNRLYTAINIFGLAVSIAAALLIFRIVHYELSFDTYHKQYDRIFTVITKEETEVEGLRYSAGLPIPAMDIIQQTVPQFAAFSRTHSCWPTITVPDVPGALIGQKKFSVGEGNAGLFVEPSFFQIFDWTWLAGDPQSALSETNGVVLSRSWAEKCFGDWKTALGKTVVMDQALPLTVRGVVEDAPVNTDFPIPVFLPYELLKKNADLFGYSPDWGNISSNDQPYALLQSADQVATVDALLKDVGKVEYQNSPTSKKSHQLEPLSALHYDEKKIGGQIGSHTTPQSRLWVLSLIGILMLGMACFNFINLATAQAASRSREVGVRKSLGSSRGQLVRQFMSETSVIVVFSVTLGTFLAFLALPLLKRISDVPDEQAFLSDPTVLSFLGITTLLVSVFSGLYPSVVLSGFEPVRALKNNITSRSVGGVSLRKILVVGQFVIAQALIVGTLITVRQMDFLKNMDLGFKPDLVYALQGISSDSSSLMRFESFRNQLMQLPGVEAVSFAADVPSSGNTWSANFALGRGSKDANFNVSMKIVDAEYFNTYGLKLIAGRTLQPSDTSREAIVNEIMLKKMGITPEEALTKEFRTGRGKWLPVVGVVADFQLSSARDEIKPVVMFSKKEYYSTAGIKIRPENMKATVPQIERIYNAVFPEQVFDGTYYDERIAEYYKDEARFSDMCKGFAGLAIFISCLGLFGLATLLASQKTKEIGVRKVLGASVAHIVGLLSKDFLMLVLLAALIACPLAWFAMNAWLEDFVYRTPVSGWIFALTVAMAAAVALLTVGIQTWRAARANPIKSLRSE